MFHSGLLVGLIYLMTVAYIVDNDIGLIYFMTVAYIVDNDITFAIIFKKIRLSSK